MNPLTDTITQKLYGIPDLLFYSTVVPNQ